MPRWFVAVALLLLTIGTYFPSFSNGFIWDDPQYVVQNPTLEHPAGILRIWFEPRSLPQYYPMVHSSFWLEARLWGRNKPMGYHVDNVLLHAVAVILLWRALAVLECPLPWLAAAVFAVHPVMVESVAWITERKNVLSLVFYLLAFHAYMRCQSKAHGVAVGLRWYWSSLLLFSFALLSKTIACSFPAAILLVTYWKTARITRADVKPLFPFFALGLFLAAFTAHIEHDAVGARGRDFQWTFLDSVLIAGRAVFFYAGKMIWPARLMFIYPRWKISTADPLQWLYPAGVVAILFSLWLLRKKIGRGPLVAALVFVGSLVPAMSFVKVYPMRYSFVADHFQYLPAIGLIAGISGVFCRGGVLPPSDSIGKIRAGGPRPYIGMIVLATLAFLSWHQQSLYKNARVLWTATTEINPTSWMPHLNLAAALRADGDPSAAFAQSQLALKFGPDEPDTHFEMATALAGKNDWPGSILELRRCVAVDPNCSFGYATLARTLWRHVGTPEAQAEAVADANRAIALNEDLADAHYVLGEFARMSNDLPTAIVQYRAALKNDDTDPAAHNDLGVALLQSNQPAAAAAEFQRAIELAPSFTTARANLATAKKQAGHVGQ